MKHHLVIEGFSYRLRPVAERDAAFIVQTRLEDESRNQFIHKISRDVSAQEKWLENYFTREGDYYFVVENKFTRLPEGLIAVYDVKDGRAEWGRWVLQKGSLAAPESVDLAFRAAFEKLGLLELYSRTVQDNAGVVSFHDSVKQKRRGVLENHFELNGCVYNAVEHFADKDYFYETVHPLLEKSAVRIFQRNLKQAAGAFEFHHIGVATADMRRDLAAYRWLGYAPDGASFEDTRQGIKGLFLSAKGQPALELLQNLEGSHTLDYWLKNKIKLYHFAYTAADIEKTLNAFLALGAKVVSPLKESVYFGKRICFLMLPNMFLFELIEK